MENLFEELNKIDVSEHIEKKKAGNTELSYLSWAWAWSEFKKRCPTATYEIKRFGERKEPYFYDESLGYMVFTSVTVDSLTYEMWLPVMDSSNKAMKKEQYSYLVKEYSYGKATGKMTEKFVEPATMFDINKTIMRCLVKNIAMFGLGLHIYAGEDLPESTDEKAEEKKEFEKMVTADKRAFNKAVKDGAQQAPEKRPLADRIKLSFAWLENLTQAEFDKNSARRDSVHEVRDICLASPDAETRETGEKLKTLIEQFEPPLDDSINF